MKFCENYNGIKLNENEIYECGNCGNHVCKVCALAWNGICPNCFSRLFRIS